MNHEKITTIKPMSNGSEVVLMRNTATEQLYVTKIIKGIKDSSLYNVIFEREVGALRKLRKCDNIVRLEHYETLAHKAYGRCGFIHLEYIDGETLHQTDVVRLSNSEKSRIVKQLIDAVQAAHEEQIIHRDISPKNIMLTLDKQIKLIDFGICKIKDMVNTNTVYQFATNRYAAPEVHMHNENATEQSDIYSLGAVMYYLYTGQEPPIPDEFERVLSKPNGIDIPIKEVITKMVSLSREDRYKNIFEVSKALSKPLARFNKSDKTFVVSIGTSKIDYMKNQSLVPRMARYKEITDKDIYEDFSDAYILVKDEGTAEEQYEIYGRHYSFECFYDTRAQVFKVTKTRKLPAHVRDIIKKKAMLVNGKLKFILSTERIPLNNNYELTIAAKDSKKEYLSASNVNNEYAKNFMSWHKLLDFMEEENQKNLLRIRYSSYRKEGDMCLFTISEHAYYMLGEIKKELSFIYETHKKRRPLRVGDYSKIACNNGKFYLHVVVTDSTIKSNLPKQGVLCEDYTKNLKLIERKKKALNDFNNEEYASTSNLKGIVAGIHNAKSFDSLSKISFYDEDLDPVQKLSVEKALNAQDIALIQGAPGAGKTKVIIEILRQLLAMNKRGKIFKQKILLVSQAHAAVDKMLEDLSKVDDSSKVIRIGREKNLSELAKEKYAVEHVQGKWIDEIVEKSNTTAQTMLAELEIDETAFYQYCDAVMELKVNKKATDSKQIVVSFREKYSEVVDTNKFKGLLIQREWVNRVVGRNDVKQYFLKSAEIVSGTCTGVVADNVIRDMVFDCVIIDEAAKATFPELLISIIRGKKVIMVGDHKQLPPVLAEDLIRSSKQRFIEHNVDYETLYDGIFKKLFEHLPEENKQLLNTQYRMHPAIGQMISSLFYENQIANGIPAKEKKHEIDAYKGLSLVWIDTSKMADRFDEPVATSYKNRLEANIVKSQLKLIDNGLGESNYDVGVITPYSGQKNLITNAIKQMPLHNIEDKVAVNTVDAFQGGERDIIIYSTVRSNPNKKKKVPFLEAKERLNVAFSRAQRLLIIVGDADFLSGAAVKDNKFQQILEYMQTNPEHCKIIDYAAVESDDKRGA